MLEKRINYLFALVLLALAATAGVLIYQYCLLQRLERRQRQMAERIEKIHHLETRNENYRALRVVPPGKRAEIYPARSTFRPGVDTLESFQHRLRADLKRWMGLDEQLLQREVILRSLGKETVDSVQVVREEVEFSFQGNRLWTLHGYLLYPLDAQGSLPGIICLNGHRGTARAVSGLEEDYTHGYGLALAAAGCMVLTFDWAFEGESRLVNPQGKQYQGHESVFEYMEDTGRRGLALYLENAYCAFKALKSHARIDTSRIAVTGISRGGELTVYFSALFASEIAAYYASGAGFPFVYRRFGGGCKCTYAEQIFDHYEFSDLLVAAAPLPGRLQLGVRDNILGYWDNIEQLLKIVRPLYERLALPGTFGLDIHEGKHEYQVQQAVAFFEKYLLK